ncbi:hypothetical protein [Undibacterium danionis]|uniref:Uncharacterized protein n=1 Tax=Undibacterium danionis TaxID=1812100 RepID=A0ABV6I9Y0_9BURK
MINLSNKSPNFPDSSRKIGVFPALKKRRQHQSNIWFFDSPKNNKRLIITSDLAFMHLVILEGDVSVTRYHVNPEPINTNVEGVQKDISIGAYVYRGNALEWWDFKRLQNKKDVNKQNASDSYFKTIAAASSLATYHVKTDVDLKGQEILFDNWLTLCAAITRCRGHFLGREATIFSERLALQHAVTLENLLTIPSIDVAYMLAVVALALQNGSLRCNLNSQLINRQTLLSRRES